MRPKRKPSLEKPYLLTCATLLAGALAVCAPLVLIQATEEQDTSWLDAEPAIAPYAVAGKGWETVVTPEPVVMADAPRNDIAALPTVKLSPADPVYTASLPEAQPDIAEIAAEDAANASEPTPEPVKVSALDEEIIDESSGASVTYAPGPEPQPIAQESLAEPVQIAALDDARAAPEPQPEEFDVSEEQTADIAPPLPPRRPAAPIKTAEIVVAQAADEQPAPKSKQAARAERRNNETSTQRWKPMALAPADADTPAPKPKLAAPAPKSTESAASHRAKVWSALARAKPRVGERGSATVSFSIGANGALRGVRVAKSSGNAMIDRLALSTVRNAGPFPPPPGLKSGATSYTIRIDF